MDIPALSTQMAQANLAQNVQVSMVKKAMDLMEQTGAQMIEMINATEVPSDSTIDIKV